MIDGITNRIPIYVRAEGDAQPVSASPTVARAQRVRLGLEHCETCAARRYVDGSNDPGVSFKAPTRVDPAASFAAVSAHEGEHVTNERATARERDMRVVSQSVSIHMATCPECGRLYAAGGVTRTRMVADGDSAESPRRQLDAYA